MSLPRHHPQLLCRQHGRCPGRAGRRHRRGAAALLMLLGLTATVTLTAGCGPGDSAVDGPSVASTDATNDGGAAIDGGTNDSSVAGQDAVVDAGVVDTTTTTADAGPDGDAQADTSLRWTDTHGGGDGQTLPGAVVALTIAPPAATFGVGSQIALAATAKLDDGSSVDASALVVWASDAPQVVQVNAAGVAVALAAGAAHVSATLDGVEGSATLTVLPVPVVKLSLSPSAATVGVGATQAFSAIATFEGGATGDVSASATWSVADATLASVDAAGLVTAKASGATVVRATVLGKGGAVAAEAKLTIPAAKVKGLSLTPASATIAVGGTVKMTLTAIYDDGSAAEVSGAATWSSSAPTAAKVDGAGVVTGVGAGVAVISASFGGQLASRPVTVAAPTVKLTGLTVTPKQSTLAAGTHVQLKAVGTFSDGSSQDLTTSAVWSTAQPGIAAVSNDPASAGRATGIAAGVATISASFKGLSAAAKLTVSAAVISKLSVTPSASTVPLGLTTPLRALGTTSDGKVLDVTSKVTWSSSPAGVATVGNGPQAGIVSGTTTGVATVTATLTQPGLAPITAKASVSVLSSVLTKITVTPASASVVVGNTAPFKATGVWSDGSSQDVTTSAVWTVSDAKHASVSNSKGSQGELSALAAGKIKLSATIGQVVGTATVTLAAPTVTKLTIGPSDATRKAGQKLQFWLVAEFSNGKSLNVTQQATWSSANPAVATINTSGFNVAVVQCKSAGKVTITASFGGKSASAQLTVTNPAITSLQVTPATWSVAAGLPMQFQAVAIFSDNTTQNVTFQAQWSSNNTQIATIGNKGPGPGGPPNKGRVQTKQPGVVTFTATFGGLKATGALTVTAAKPTGITVFPGQHTCTKGEMRGFQATLLFSDGTSQNVTQAATWLSSDSKVASALNGKNQKGIVQCLATGDVTISAAVSSYKGAAKLTVKAATVTKLQIQPKVWSVAVGVPVKFDAMAVMSDNTTQNVSWQTTFVSSDSSVATVFNGGGTAGWTQTLKPGTVTVTATWSGHATTATLTVKKAEVKSIELSPAQPVVVPGTYVKLNAVAILTDNTTQQITPAASWTSDKPGVATVFNGAQGNPQANQNKGLVQTLTPGKATISATWGGKTGSTVITVQPVALKELQVTPFAPVLPVGYITPLRATALFADLSTQDLTPQVSWTSSDPSVAAVASVGPTKGWVTPLKKGKAVITAAWNGTLGKTEVTVTDAKLLKVTVVAPKTTLAVQETVPLKAMGAFSGGLQLDITPYATWLTGDAGVVGVSNAFGSWGQAKGLKVGAATVTAVRDGVQGGVGLVVK